MALTIGQEKCVNTLDKPLAVSAGAGSGKTFTLTRRIVHALESGYLTDIDQVLAITFTSKAAGEIKSRVKGALRAGGMTEQALKTDEAWISTIHGMCSRILRAHALELGLDPAFKVADEATVKTLLDASLEEVLGGRDDLVTVAEGVSPQRLDALFASFDVHPAGPRTASVEGMVRQLVEAASAHPDGMASVVAPPEAPSPIKLLAQLADTAETAYVLADGVKPGSTRDKFLAATQDALEGARELIGRGSDGLTYRRVLSAMNGFPAPGRNFGKNTPYGEQAAELAEQYCAIAAQARCGLVQEQLATLIDVAKSVADAFARRKREAGLLDNNDLLSFASRAFRDHPAIQAAYADRFKLVMVDEFQDTDQLQVDMIKRMAGEGFSRMCTVGDAQQSIYRFRGADVSVYRRHLEDVRTRNPEGIIELPDNFRSHGDVLALCDCIFEQPQVFGAGFMSLAPGRAESKVKRPFLPDGPRVQVQVTVAPSRGVSSADAAAVAARRVAKSFSEFAAAGHRPGDMVVLLGGMSRANVYAEALRAEGLPCVVAGGSIFNRASEVALMVRLAQAIANPKWTTALFEVLSSELFALSADDLLELSTGMDEERGIPRRRAFDQGFRHIERKVAAGRAVSPALAACASLMRRAAEQVGNVALADIMQGIVADSGWLARLEAVGPEGLARAGNVYKAIRMARDIEAAGGMGPAGVAEELTLRVELAKEAPGALSAEGGDFVRIMTVHASKGLEFPIVAVAELRDDAARSQALECCSIEGRTYVSLDGGHVLERLKEKTSSLVAKSGSYQPFFEFDDEELTAMVSRSQLPADRRAAIKLHEERGEAAESRRLLYVALTRAKEALVVSMRGKSSKVDATGLSKSCWGDVQSALVGEGCVFEPGVSMFDFGGQRPARVECVHLTPAVVEEMLGDADGVAGDAADGAALRVDGGPGVDEAAAGGLLDGVATDGGLGVGGQGVGEAAVGGSLDGGKPGVIALPVVRPYEPERGRPYAGARANMFSYSSIAEDAAGLADFSVEDAADDAVSASLGARDADAATSLGTAFHRLVQLAALAWQPGCALERPDAARQQALERSCGLSADQRDRLDAALERWFASDIAVRVSACESVQAEAPFLVRVGGLCDAAYLEGEIDLLGRVAPAGTRGQPAGSALVVDYKTGGLPGETAEQLHEKHLLQATCYAYAVLLEGYAQVECVFVRVEQDRADAPGQPQTVSYRFDAADADEMGRALARAYHGHGQL
ncbi:exodeoxyribonuclease V subunit beta [uncultured Senegalimassilia sp.]|uniref:UvrD-helicase domain-containing protein n=1 Tax=uncultured Senegalimassilia sp. TaxID=1714350 RepID=UPI0025DA4457|nr:UvrD-helicase domain-containing protein [uncultured Senegalimassilia sp.]